jgi:hypothetical protein
MLERRKFLAITAGLALLLELPLQMRQSQRPLTRRRSNCVRSHARAGTGGSGAGEACRTLGRNIHELERAGRRTCHSQRPRGRAPDDRAATPRGSASGVGHPRPILHADRLLQPHHESVHKSSRGVSANRRFARRRVNSCARTSLPVWGGCRSPEVKVPITPVHRSTP